MFNISIGYSIILDSSGMFMNSKQAISKQVIFIYGNETLELDNLAVRIGHRLMKDSELKKRLKFCFSNEPDIILKTKTKKILILDVAKGIEDIQIITNRELDVLVTKKIYSLHDLNLGVFIKILNSTGELKGKELMIIAVPYDWHNRFETAFEKVKDILICYMNSISKK